jgi:hypothetical protein
VPSHLRAIVADVRSSGATSVRAIADELNCRAILTPRGGQWQRGALSLYSLSPRRPLASRKLQRLIEIGLVERVDNRYYMTTQANVPLQREVVLAHLRNMQAAMEEVSKMDMPGAPSPNIGR